MTIATTNRGTPTGFKLRDGFPISIAFANQPTLGMWEVELTPPGLDGGEPIDQTTQFNTALMTKDPQPLIDVTPCSGTAAYDAATYATWLTMINVSQAITFHFANGDMLAFYGYLRRITPDRQARGKQPRCEFEIVPTNEDPTTFAESAPEFTAASGTDM